MKNRLKEADIYPGKIKNIPEIQENLQQNWDIAPFW